MTWFFIMQILRFQTLGILTTLFSTIAACSSYWACARTRALSSCVCFPISKQCNRIDFVAAQPNFILSEGCVAPFELNRIESEWKWPKIRLPQHSEKLTSTSSMKTTLKMKRSWQDRVLQVSFYTSCWVIRRDLIIWNLSGLSEAEVGSLLSQNKLFEALVACLANPSIGTKNQTERVKLTLPTAEKLKGSITSHVFLGCLC